MKPNNFTLILLITLAAGIASVPTLGSIVPRLSLEEMVQSSDAIVEGLVENVESRWEDRMIFSYVTIRIDDTLKGRRSRTAVVRQLGGRVGNRVLDVPGMPEFRSGDRVIAFLKQARSGTFHVVGMAQGRYRVDNDRAVATLAGADFVSRAGARIDQSTTITVNADAFKTRIRGMVR